MRQLVFQPEIAGQGAVPLGARAEELFFHLDLLGRLHDLPELVSFADLRPVPGNRRADLQKWIARGISAEAAAAELKARMLKKHGPWTQWFDPAEGVRLFRGLVEILQRDGFRESIRLIPEARQMLTIVPPDLIVELNQAVMRLEQAASAGARFRIEEVWSGAADPVSQSGAAGKPFDRPALDRSKRISARPAASTKLDALREQRIWDYFRAAIAETAGLEPWESWFPAHEPELLRLFGEREAEQLRKRKLAAVRTLLRREQLPWQIRISVLPYSRQFDEHDVASLERESGRGLPADYREFLLAYGSGLPQPKWFCVTPEDGTPQWWMVTSLAIQESDERIPGYLTIGQLWPAGATTSECLLLLKLESDGFGSGWSCRDKVRKARPAPELMSESFAALLQGLCYPPEALPWMKLIDEADVSGFQQWLNAGGEFDHRDPVSEYTPIEYAAGTHDPTALVGGKPEDLPLRLAGFAIVQLLLNGGAKPGRAIRRAFCARNDAIVELLAPAGLDGLLESDIADLRYSLNREPSRANPELRKAVEREHRWRKAGRSSSH